MGSQQYFHSVKVVPHMFLSALCCSSGKTMEVLVKLAPNNLSNYHIHYPASWGLVSCPEIKLEKFANYVSKSLPKPVKSDAAWNFCTLPTWVDGHQVMTLVLVLGSEISIQEQSSSSEVEHMAVLIE